MASGSGKVCTLAYTWAHAHVQTLHRIHTLAHTHAHADVHQSRHRHRRVLWLTLVHTQMETGCTHLLRTEPGLQLCGSVHTALEAAVWEMAPRVHSGTRRGGFPGRAGEEPSEALEPRESPAFGLSAVHSPPCAPRPAEQSTGSVWLLRSHCRGVSENPHS